MDTVTDTSWLWLENSALSALIRQWVWSYPIIEAVHILALAVLFGSVTMFDLRLLGISRQILVTDLAQHLLPWTYLSFAIAAVSGLFLFSVDASTIAVNPAFRLKLLFIVATGINAALFHGRIYQSVRLWNKGVKAPVAAKVAAIISLILWVAVIVCGHLIAYL